MHHTRKGVVSPGDPDAARGASSLIGAGRVVLTLCAMSEEDAEMLGMANDRKTRSAYIRLDDAKQNYAALGEARWYEKVVYALDNGEHVPAAVPWQAPDMWDCITVAVANRILDDIDAGMEGGRRYSDAPNAEDRAAWKVVVAHVPSLNEKQAREVVKHGSKTERCASRSTKTRPIAGCAKGCSSTRQTGLELGDDACVFSTQRRRPKTRFGAGSAASLLAVL